MAEIFIPLSPAESLLLFNNGYSSRQALKVTLLELIARKILRVETRQEQRVFRKEAVQYLRVLVHHVPDAPAHVASLLDTLKAAQPGGGIALDAVTKLLRNRYGNKVDMFKDDLLLPALVARGLMAEQRSGLFWLGKRLQLTGAGAAEHKRIAAAVGKARQIVELLKTGPPERRLWRLRSARRSYCLTASALSFAISERPFANIAEQAPNLTQQAPSSRRTTSNW
jgi:hypothetical protein